MLRSCCVTLIVLLSALSGLCGMATAQNWQRIITPTGSGDLVTPYFLNSDVGFTFVAAVNELRGNPNVPGNYCRLARTTDGGTSWMLINFFDSIGCPISQLCFVSLMHGYASTISPFGDGLSGIFETFDQGIHWKRIIAGSASFESVYAANGSVFAVEFSGGLGTQLLYSRNDGASWDSVPRPGTQTYSLPPYYGGFQWAYGNRDSLVASIYLYPNANVYLVYSSDLGNHWQSVVVDQNYQWPMEALFLAPHSCHILREFLDNQDRNNDTYSFLEADPPYTGWNFAIQHVETGAWIAGNACERYISFAGQQYARGPILRSSSGGAWSFVGNSHTDGREPNIDEIDDNDWQNLSVVGYGAAVYAMGTDYSGYLWRTTNGGDGTLNESSLAPEIALARSAFFSGNDTLVTSLCIASQIAVSFQNLACANTKLNSFSIAGLASTEFTDSVITHDDCASLPDSILLAISPTAVGTRAVSLNMKFVDDEYHEKDTSVTFFLQVRPGTTVPLALSVGTGPVAVPAGDTVAVPVYLSGATDLGATTISLPFAIDTNALVPIGFQTAIAGFTTKPPVYSNGRLEIELRSSGFAVSSDTLLGVLQCVAYVGDTLSTSVSLQGASIDAQNVPCLALSLAADSLEVNIVACGSPLLQQLMRSGNVSLNIRTIEPDPALDRVQIEFENAGSSPIVYQVMDALGTVREQGTTSASAVRLDTHSLSSGLYFLLARTNSGARAVGKFLVQR